MSPSNKNMHIETIDAPWRALELALAMHGSSPLNPPATMEAIEQLQRHVAIALPQDYVDSLRLHDGQAANTPWLFPEGELLSSSRVMRRWSIWHDLWQSGEFSEVAAIADDGILPTWWHPGWIPFTYNGAGDHLCVDMSPAPGGTVGQVITLWHDDGKRTRVAHSFAEWFTHAVAQRY